MKLFKVLYQIEYLLLICPIEVLIILNSLSSIKHYSILQTQDKAIKLLESPPPLHIEQTIYFPFCIEYPSNVDSEVILPRERLSNNCLMNFKIIHCDNTSIAKISKLNSDIMIALCRYYDCSNVKYTDSLKNYAEICSTSLDAEITIKRLETLEYYVEQDFRNGYYNYFIHKKKFAMGIHNFTGLFVFSCIILKYEAKITQSRFLYIFAVVASLLVSYLVNHKFYLYYKLISMINFSFLLVMEF